MNNNGGTSDVRRPGSPRRGRPWGPEYAGVIRDELLGAYRKTLRRITSQPGLAEHGVSMFRVVVEAAEAAVEASEPVWLTPELMTRYRSVATSPTSTDDLIAAGRTGLLLFDRPVTRASQDGAGMHGAAPVFGALWWTSYFDGETFEVDADEPNLVTVHELSTEISPGFPWPEVWDDSTLGDLGFFSVGLDGQAVLLDDQDSDLAPLISLLLGYGAAARHGRLRTG